MSWSDVPLMMNTAELRSLVHDRWQERVVDAFRERGWRPARHDASGGPVPWEEVASTAVEMVLARCRGRRVADRRATRGNARG